MKHALETGTEYLELFTDILMVVVTLVKVNFGYFTSLPACQILVAAASIPCCTHSFNSNFCYVHTKTIYSRWNFNFLLRQGGD